VAKRVEGKGENGYQCGCQLVAVALDLQLLLVLVRALDLLLRQHHYIHFNFIQINFE